MNKTLWIGIGFLLAVGVVAGYLLLGGKGARSPYSVSTLAPIVPNTPAGQGPTKQVSVSATEYSFNPSSLSFTQGDHAILTFKNMGQLPHNLIIDELGVATKTIGGGETDTVEFTVSKSGNFSFYCSVDAHRSLGLEGKLKVQ